MGSTWVSSSLAGTFLRKAEMNYNGERSSLRHYSIKTIEKSLKAQASGSLETFYGCN